MIPMNPFTSSTPESLTNQATTIYQAHKQTWQEGGATLTFFTPFPLCLLLPAAILLLVVLDQPQWNSSSPYQNCFHKVRSKEDVNAW